MFILDSNEVKSAMYAKGLKTETSIELWHKRIGHINLQRLRMMQSKGVVIRLLAFNRNKSTECAKHANSANNIDSHSRRRAPQAKASLT